MPLPALRGALVCARKLGTRTSRNFVGIVARPALEYVRGLTSEQIDKMTRPELYRAAAHVGVSTLSLRRDALCDTLKRYLDGQLIPVERQGDLYRISGEYPSTLRAVALARWKQLKDKERSASKKYSESVEQALRSVQTRDIDPALFARKRDAPLPLVAPRSAALSDIASQRAPCSSCA
jgi:hypothetical protein